MPLRSPTPSPSLSAKLRTKASYQVRWFQSPDGGVVAVTHEEAGREAVGGASEPVAGASDVTGDADAAGARDADAAGARDGTPVAPCGAVPHDASASDARRTRARRGVAGRTGGSLAG